LTKVEGDSIVHIPPQTAAMQRRGSTATCWCAPVCIHGTALWNRVPVPAAVQSRMSGISVHNFVSCSMVTTSIRRPFDYLSKVVKVTVT